MFFLNKDERLRLKLLRLASGMYELSVVIQLYKFVKGDDHALDDFGNYMKWKKEQQKKPVSPI